MFQVCLLLMDQLAEEDTSGPLLLQTVTATKTQKPQPLANCRCSNIIFNWTHGTPDIVGHDYFCDNNSKYTEDGRFMIMIYGMGRDVPPPTLANSTTHLTSANMSTIPHLSTWKLGSCHVINQLPLCPS